MLKFIAIRPSNEMLILRDTETLCPPYRDIKFNHGLLIYTAAHIAFSQKK